MGIRSNSESSVSLKSGSDRLSEEKFCLVSICGEFIIIIMHGVDSTILYQLRCAHIVSDCSIRILTACNYVHG